MAVRKQMEIKLVVEVKEDGTLVEKTYKTPHFIPFAKLIAITKKMEGLEKKSEMDALVETLEVVVDLYENQFSIEELQNGLNAPEAVKVIQQNIEFLSTGELPKK